MGIKTRVGFYQSVVILVVPLLVAAPSRAAVDALTLDQFLDQVKTKHTGFRSATIGSEAASNKSEEASLLYSPNFFTEASFRSDARLPNTLFLVYRSLNVFSLSFGVRQQTSFGLSGSLRYEIMSQTYINPQSNFGAGGSSLFFFQYAVASPVIEFSQSLWSNGFGRTTRAQHEQIEAAQQAAKYMQSYQAKAILTQAEATYWRLASARHLVAVQTEALDRARKIYEWTRSRADKNLADKADALQSEALYKSRQAELINGKNELLSATRAFNATRNIDSTEVTEVLSPIDPKLVESLEVPKKSDYPDQVKALQEQARAEIASSIIGLERDRPTFDIFANLALNGQTVDYPVAEVSESIAKSFTFNRPTYTVGFKFSMPLAFGSASDAREGHRQEQVSSEMELDRKVFETDQTWKDLNQNLMQTREHYDLARSLEEVQKEKLERERERLKMGRTTTYQVLLFEQDYLFSQLALIQDQAKILNIVAQMKLFGESI